MRKLESIPFHDATMAYFEICGKQDLVKIEVLLYDMVRDDYDRIQIEFKNATNIRVDTLLELDKSEEIEINTVNIKEGKVNFIEFVLLLGFAKPSANLSFEYDRYEIS